VLDFRHRHGANQLGDEPGGIPGVPYSDYTGYTPANAKLFFALTNAVFDGGCSAWDNKRAFGSVRPITAIRHLDGKRRCEVRATSRIDVGPVQSPSGAIRYSAGPVDVGPCGIESIRHGEEPSEGADVALDGARTVADAVAKRCRRRPSHG
jgi:hypothetical protein